MDTPKTVRERLIYAMQIGKVNPRILASQLGIHRSTISHWINKRYPVSPRYYLEVCNILNISVRWLTEGIGNIKDPSFIHDQYEVDVIKIIRKQDERLRQIVINILKEIEKIQVTDVLIKK